MATLQYDFPTDAVLSQIDKDLLDDRMQDDPIFDDFPMVNVDSDRIIWEQQDNTTGLMQARGINGDPPSIKRLGGKRFQMEPGIYGEFGIVDELELTRRRPWGQFSGKIDVSDLVGEIQMQLQTRQMNRVRWIIWQLLIKGTFNVPNAAGAIVHSDTYAPQTFTSQVPWTTYATATPLADFRAVQLLHRGHSVMFGPTAKLYVNQTTANAAFSNTNSADIYGRRTNGLGTYNSLAQFNQLFMGDGLPQIVIYDDFYISDGTDGNTAGTYQLFIPDGYGILVGARSNRAKIGDVAVTRHASLDGRPGVVSKVIDHGDRAIPRKIEVHRSVNMGPRVYYPSAIVVMKLF